MRIAQMDIGGLVFTQQGNFVATCDLSRAFNQNPVLSTVAVLLQAWACAGFDL